MRALGIGLVIAGALLGTRPAGAETGFFLEGATGTSVHAPTDLTLRQYGFQTLDYEASWETRPFSGHAPYYRVRAGFGPLFLEFLHDKFYLENTGSTIQHFEISHGYSLLGAGLRLHKGPLNAFIAAGPVLTFEHNTVRGLAYEGDYAFSGGGAHVGGAVWIPLGPVALTFELGASAGWARVNVANGDADVTDLSVHLTAGLALTP